MKTKTRIIKWCLFTVLLEITACSTYHPELITHDTPESGLRPPGNDAVQEEAARIKHPIVKPLNLQPEKGLSPETAGIMAVLLSPALRAARDQKNLTEVQVIQAGILPNPELNFDYGFPTGGDTKGEVAAYGLSLDWDVTSLIARASKIDQANAGLRVVDLDIAWQEWQVAQAAKSATYQLIALQNKILIARQSLQQISEELVQVRNSVEKGFATPQALGALEAANSKAEEKLLELKKECAAQQLQLKRIIGLPFDSRLDIDTSARLPLHLNVPDDSDILKGLEQRRLDILALQHGYESQEYAVRAAVLRQFPKITIGPSINREIDNAHTVGFGVTLGIPVFSHNQTGIDQERATRRRLYDEYINRVFEARSDVALALSAVRSINDQISAAWFANQKLEQLVDSYRSALSRGHIDALSYSTARSEFLAAQIHVVELQAQLAQEMVALQLAAGLYELPDHASTNKTAPSIPPKGH